MDVEDKLTIEEFVIYSSPRYHRLIFEELKPETKNGDLVSALGELKQVGIVTPDTVWEKVRLTKKGSTYKKLIKKLVDLDALHSPQTEGLFDYRTDIGRKAIVEIIRFFSAKLNFNDYFQYLKVPLFDKHLSESDWNELFGAMATPDGSGLETLTTQIVQPHSEEDSPTKPMDYSSEASRNALMTFLKKREGKYSAQRTISHHVTGRLETFDFNLSILKKYLKKIGMNRVEPLFNHFKTCIPQLFQIHERQFTIDLLLLDTIYKILEEGLIDFQKEDNRWMGEYLNLLEVPTNLFGLCLSNFTYATKEIDAFLNLAVTGPKIIASQFSSIPSLGILTMIIFPITPKESIVISCNDLDMLYYFTIPTDQCLLNTYIALPPNSNFSESYVSSSRRLFFGKLDYRSPFPTELQNYELEEIESSDKSSKSTPPKVVLSPQITQQLENYSKFSVTVYTMCQLITQKFTPTLIIPKCFCVFENGLISFTKFKGEEHILTTINLGKVQLGPELQKMWQKVTDSVEEILEKSTEMEDASEKS